MKIQVLSRRLLQSQETFESGKCSTFDNVPYLSSIVVFTKNKKTSTEEDLLLKISFLQLFFNRKIFLLVGFKNNQVLKKSLLVVSLL